MWILLVSIFGAQEYLWHSRQINDAIASEEAFLVKITIIKFFLVKMIMYVPIFWGLDAHGGRKLQ